MLSLFVIFMVLKKVNNTIQWLLPNNHYWFVCSKLGKQHCSFLSKLGINEFHCQFFLFKPKLNIQLNQNIQFLTIIMVKKQNPDTVRMPKGLENSNKELPHLHTKHYKNPWPNTAHYWSCAASQLYIALQYLELMAGIQVSIVRTAYSHVFSLQLIWQKLQYTNIFIRKLVIICLLKNLTMNQSSFTILCSICVK